MNNNRYLTFVTLIFIAISSVAAIINFTVDPYDIQRRDGMIPTKDKAQINTHVRLTKAYTVDQIQPKTVILGTSRAEFGLAPDAPAFNEVYQPVYNLGLSGANIYEIRRYLEHANANENIEHAILALDFFSFSGLTPNKPDFSEKRLNSERPFLGLTREDFLATVLSVDALIDSVSTYQRRNSPSDIYYIHNGLRDEKRYNNTIQSLGGHRVLFDIQLRSFINHLWYPSSYGHHQFNYSNKESTTLEQLRTLVAYCRTNDISLTLFISPTHAEHWAAMHIVGLWPAFESWKLRIASIVEADKIEHSDKRAIPLWDFSGIHSITTEPVPESGNADTLMENFFESSHYRPRVGNMILEKILNNNTNRTTHSFGMSVSLSTLPSQFAKQRQAVEQYISEYPEVVKHIKTFIPQLD